MKSTFESQILDEFWLIAKTNIFKMQIEKKAYTYKITAFLKYILISLPVSFSIAKTKPNCRPT